MISGKSLSSQPERPRSYRPPATGFAEAPDRDLFQLASELIDPALKDIPRVVNPQPVSYLRGRMDTFWLIDLADLEIYQRRFELMLVTPNAYWYVEEDKRFDLQDLERSAAVFEETIYPRVTSAFGREWNPGVDNDPHLNILNGFLKGAAGYYSSGDEYPEAVSPYSNQREIIYINMGAYALDSPEYLEVLAHELQHAIHWRADPSEETWVNEGLSEFATAIAGYPPRSIYRFLSSSPTSVLHWPLSGVGGQASYGGASLFMHYLIEHYGDPTDLKPLLEQPEDGIAGIEAYLAELGRKADFGEVFGNWMAANVLDLESGPYSYPNLEVQSRVHRFINPGGTLESSIPQYAPEYLRVTLPAGPLLLAFRAPAETPLLPVDVGAEGCWWSNSGDSIDSTLTRALDLRGDLTGASRPTLDYQVWYDVEENWDYVYLEVSEDGGATWDIIDTPNASPANPVGNGYGPGYTGSSNGWLNQSIDLTPYAGKDVQLRFQYVTDDAINGSGLCLRRFSLSLDSSAGAPYMALSADGWNPQGFIAIDNRVRQDFIVKVIWESQPARVEDLDLKMSESGDWIGELLVEGAGETHSLIVAVAALAPKTRLHAGYTFTVTAAP
ncbi:MAG: immune inhibitor A [Chloroflexi bacterium]|nr:immune inhibitor A [Chloroflexota bacterium]